MDPEYERRLLRQSNGRSPLSNSVSINAVSYMSLLPNGKAQNNFQRVAGHNDQPKKFLLGLALFLTGQKPGKILINPCVIFYCYCIFTD